MWICHCIMYKRNINYAKSKHILIHFGCIAICIDLTVGRTLQAYMNVLKQQKNNKA